MRKLPVAHSLGLILLVGCANTKVAPSPVSPPPAQAAPPGLLLPQPSAAPIASDDTKPAVTPPANAAQSPPPKVSIQKSSKPPPSASVPSVARKPAAPANVVAPVSVAPAPKATLDFKTLVERLRNTSAIGVFTKLSVKNQVDDLLGDFRGYYAGKVPPTIDDLHARYEGLVLKVVTLIQNGDAPLASAISASRSAIWERLSNRESFQAI